MDDLQSDVCVFPDNPSPRRLYQYLPDQFFFCQMGNEDGCSVYGDAYEMDIKQIEGNLAYRFDVVPKIRGCGDQDILQQEQAHRHEEDRRCILELVYEQMENFLRPS